jgi:hypothetical protein
VASIADEDKEKQKNVKIYPGFEQFLFPGCSDVFRSARCGVWVGGCGFSTILLPDFSLFAYLSSG